MIRALFLFCALALPSPVIRFHGKADMTAREFVHEYRMLVEFLAKDDPGGEFLVMSGPMHLVPKGYTRLPIVWRGNAIYRRAA